MRYYVLKPRKRRDGTKGKRHGYRIVPPAGFPTQAWEAGFRLNGTGYTTERETRAFVEEKIRDAERRAHLIAQGLPIADLAPIAERIREYLAWGRLQGGKRGLPWAPGHVEHLETYLREWVDALGVSSLTEIRQPAFDRQIVAMAARLAPNTVNHRARTLTAFCRWAVVQGYLPAMPLRFNALDKTPKVERGAFMLAELRDLFESVPWARGVVYRAAYYLRLRRSELASLKVRSVDWVDRGVNLSYRHAKDRRDAFIPVPPGLMAEFWKCADGKDLDAPLFDFSWKHAALLIHRDMERLGIPLMLNGRRRDFHSLGASTATSMDRIGVGTALMQKAMRHKSWAMTANYVKTETEQVRAVIDHLEAELEPAVNVSVTQEVHMHETTNNDGASEDKGPESLTLRQRVLQHPAAAKSAQKFRKFPRDTKADPALSWANAQKIFARIGNALSDPRFARDLQSFLALSPAERAALLPKASRRAG